MLADFLQGATQFVQQILGMFGVPGVSLIALMENLFPPTPSEFLYPLAGKMAYEGGLSPLVVIAAGVTGSLIGSLIFYTLGYRLGAARIRSLIGRFGHFRIGKLHVRFLSVQDYDRALHLFERYGGPLVFVARIMPLVHGVVSVPAGVVRMNLPLFILYTALGAACWIAPLTLFGYWLGNRWNEVLTWLDLYENLWYLFIALVVAFFLWRRLRSGRGHRATLEHGINQPTHGI
ncbi:MAG: DedA family protein [bacterium]|nr:DedA family protein [bacterium]